MGGGTPAPPYLRMSQRQTDTIVSFRRTQDKESIGKIASTCNLGDVECKSGADLTTQPLRAYCQQAAASDCDLDEALESFGTDREGLKDNPQWTMEALLRTEQKSLPSTLHGSTR